MTSELFQESTWLLCVELVQVVLYLLLMMDSMFVYNILTLVSLGYIDAFW